MSHKEISNTSDKNQKCFEDEKQNAVQSQMQRGETSFEFQNKEPPAIAWVCLSKDDFMVVLGDESLTAGFKASHQKDEALISKQTLGKAIQMVVGLTLDKTWLQGKVLGHL